MNCLHPIRLRPDSPMLLPCKRCMACRIQHTREWAVRLMHELDYHDRASFVTLTYDDDHLPVDGGLDKRALQLFLKRYRKSAAPGPIKYYACGEYGGRFGRPHYHLIIYGDAFDRRDDRRLLEVWPYGFNSSGSVTYDSCRYVAGYCIDKLNGPLAAEVYQGRQPPFQLQSKGLGKDWAFDNKEQILSGKEFTLHGRPIGLPAYYARKLDYKDYDRAAKKSAAAFKERAQYLPAELAGLAATDEYMRRMDVISLDQAALNLEARQRLYGRNKK